MAQGRITRASERHPGHRRRQARYGKTRYGQSGGLPPHLLKGVTGQDTAKRGGGNLARIAIIGGTAILSATVLFIIVTAISTVLGISGTMRAYRDVNAELPNAANVAVDTFQTTQIYDRNGVLLQEVDNPDYGWRTFVPMSDMSPHFVNATVAAEDSTFWTNDGVEPFAIVRGGFIIFTGAGSSGGSTITQQLVRSIYPDQISGLDISLTRKGREALAAVALNRQYSKTDIFTMYVNQIYYGARAYGVEAAAQTYFTKNARDLTLAESAMLAGLPQAPSAYDPTQFFEQAKARQEYVLDQMVKYRYITREEADRAWEEPLTIRQSRTGAVNDAPHFTEYVREYVVANYGEDALYGGLRITTSIDLDLQARAEETLASGVAGLEAVRRNNGAMVIMVPWSGEVLAMVGSADFTNQLISGEVNYATSLIQPGSSMKPLVYAAAFERGWHPGSMIMDVPTEWPNPGEEPYEPNNYSGQFYGAVSARTSLANSFNISAVKATEFVGVQGVMDTSRRMGLVDSLEEDAGYYGLSLGLGAGEVQLLEHTNAYATLANNGKNVPPHPIIEIKDSQGNVLYDLTKEQVDKESTQAVPAGNAYQVTSILTDNEAREMIFSADNLFGRTQEALDRPTAAKSGTTDDWKDLWTMGYTTDVAIGVWVGTSGDVDAENLQEIDGIQAAGPIWEDMMVEVHNSQFSDLLVGPDGNAVAKEFPQPDDVYRGEICSSTGHKPGGGGGTVEEWLVRGQEPTLPCNELSEYEREELNKAIQEARSGRGPWASGAIDRISRYANAANVRGAPSESQSQDEGGNNTIEQSDGGGDDNSGDIDNDSGGGGDGGDNDSGGGGDGGDNDSGGSDDGNTDPGGGGDSDSGGDGGSGGDQDQQPRDPGQVIEPAD